MEVLDLSPSGAGARPRGGRRTPRTLSDWRAEFLRARCPDHRASARREMAFYEMASANRYLVVEALLADVPHCRDDSVFLTYRAGPPERVWFEDGAGSVREFGARCPKDGGRSGTANGNTSADDGDEYDHNRDDNGDEDGDVDTPGDGGGGGGGGGGSRGGARTAPYVLTFVGIEVGGGSRHATLLLFDTEERAVEYFEPHGAARWNRAVDAFLRDAVRRRFPAYRFVSSREYEPERGPQAIAGDLHCFAWSMLYAFLRVRVPWEPRERVAAFLTEHARDACRAFLCYAHGRVRRAPWYACVRRLDELWRDLEPLGPRVAGLRDRLVALRDGRRWDELCREVARARRELSLSDTDDPADR